MNLYTHKETIDGFDITFNALVEDWALEDFFDSSVEDIAELYRKIEQGDLAYFCAQVTASKCGIDLASDYLGACLYDSYEDFHTGENRDYYYIDMVNIAIEEAKQAIDQLKGEVAA